MDEAGRDSAGWTWRYGDCGSADFCDGLDHGAGLDGTGRNGTDRVWRDGLDHGAGPGGAGRAWRDGDRDSTVFRGGLDHGARRD